MDHPLLLGVRREDTFHDARPFGCDSPHLAQTGLRHRRFRHECSWPDGQ
jgi:hypothetical protein